VDKIREILNENGKCGLPSIKKHLSSKYGLEQTPRFRSAVNKVLKAGVESGIFKQKRGSYVVVGGEYDIDSEEEKEDNEDDDNGENGNEYQHFNCGACGKNWNIHNEEMDESFTDDNSGAKIYCRATTIYVTCECGSKWSQEANY